MQKPKICIVGPGVVGQATGKVFASHGLDVSFLGGFPEQRKKLIEEGYKSYDLHDLMNGDYDFDITMFTVPTPSAHDGKINLDAVNSASIDLGKRLKGSKNYHLVVVKSTVPPGTTENLCLKNVEEYSGKKLGKDLGACMNPEYLREKTACEDSLNAWLIVIGEWDKKSGDMLSLLYKKFKCPLFRVSIQEAEMQKYVHNLFNAAKISFFNEMREIAKGMGADADKIFQLTAISAEGIWNPMYGIRDRGPFNGSCLPKDTNAFLHWAKAHGHDVTLLQAVIDANKSLIEKLDLEKFDYSVPSRL